MLMPKRTKYRRPHRVSYEGKAKGGKEVTFGEFGLQSLEGAWITDRQIWIKIFPHNIITKKPLEVRMGSGKGAPDGYVAVVKDGTVMFEVAGVSEEIAREALRLAAYKLPIKCRIVKKDDKKGE